MSRKDVLERPYELAGIVMQAAADAAEKALSKVISREGYDAAFWGVRLTLDLGLLDDTLARRQQTIRITETQNWNWPDEGEGEGNEN